MDLELLIAEIGSTTTMVNGFKGLSTDDPSYVGQGMAPTTVLEGDVMIGLEQAIEDLKENLQVEELQWQEFMATSSAAGGLKMSVHGLVKEMTVRAAEEAALGAGAVIKLITAGKLRERQLKQIRDIQPNIILLAGGVDYGEEETIIYNAEKLAGLGLQVPVIYAGNSVLQDEVEEIFQEAGTETIIVENVYPDIDRLNIEPTRREIHEVFARHIVRAPGMSRIQDMLTAEMMPTPGAVMEAAKLLKSAIGNLVVFDVGGATTDVHSVTEESGKVRDMLVSPEPEAKRTVEGDLGVYLNASHVFSLLKDEFDLPAQEDLAPIPRNKEEEKYVEHLTARAVKTALERHAGTYRDYYGSGGRQTVAEGKDLTAVRWMIGTGGALTRLPGGKMILKTLRNERSRQLLPPPEAEPLIDEKYIMASLGVMSQKYPEAALHLLLDTLNLKEEDFEEQEARK
ncbi:MAG: GlmL-related ornithine degradation protein [Bacillota bacterium]